MGIIENRTFGELRIGDSASLSRTLTRQDIELFAAMSGDVNPAHVDDEYAQAGLFHRVVAHGIWSAALISTVLGTMLPGPGTIYLAQSLRFLHPVAPGDTVTVRVEVTALDPQRRHARLACSVLNQDRARVLEGEAEVLAPDAKVRRPRAELPEVLLRERGLRQRALIARAANAPPLRTAVAYPVDAASLGSVLGAARAGLIEPVLVGPPAAMREAARVAGIDIGSWRIVAAADAGSAAAQAVALARAGETGAVLQGALDDRLLMHEVLDPVRGLRGRGRISHAYAVDSPAYPRPLLLTDAVLNRSPTLDHKRDIVSNAVRLAHALGIAAPRVALLSAQTTVDARQPSTVDAAALCKMAQRGQIAGAILDGPLDLATALTQATADAAAPASPVAGQADVLVAPDLECGSLLAGQFGCLEHAVMAGVLVGARVPVILAGRFDAPLARLASCALAGMLAHAPATVSDAG